MNMKEGLENKIMSDFKGAQKEFELYEKFYLGLSEKAKIYLKCESKKYKKIVLAIQKVIQPSVRMNCTICKIQCCKLYIPELSISIAKSVGCFNLINYLIIFGTGLFCILLGLVSLSLEVRNGRRNV